jgi:ligand-binding sensor domain-containing protein/two-component sensor histidine kinase
MRTNTCFFLLLLGLLTVPAGAQKPIFLNYGVKEGLPSQEVYKVLQDGEKYLWFATEHGVSRYDGTSFVNFSTQEGLPDNVVIELYRDPKGRIWFIPISGPPCYYYKGSIHQVKIAPEHRTEMFPSVTVDSTGKILMGAHGGLFISDAADSMIFHPRQTIGGHSRFVGVDRNNVVWMRSVTCFAKSGNYYNTLDFVEKFRDNTFFQNIFNYKSYELLRETYDIENGKIKVINGGNDRLLQYISGYLGSSSVIFLKKDRRGNIWAGTHGNGLYCFEGRLPAIRVRSFLPKSGVSSMEEDFEGNLWFTTIGEGVFRCPSLDFNTVNVSDGMIDNKIWSIARDSRGSVWMGGSNATVQVMSGKSIRIYNLGQSLISRKRIVCLMPGRDGSMYVGTDDFAFLYRNGAFKKLAPLVTREMKTDFYSVKCMASFREGLAIGTNGTIYWLGPDSTVNIGQKAGMGYFRVYSVQPDHEGHLLAGTNKGLYRFDRATYRATQLHGARVSSIVLLANGTQVYSTLTDGLIFNGKSSFSIDSKNGLPGNICKKLVKENDSTLWVITNTGISRIDLLSRDRKRFRISSFDDTEGLASNEVSDLFIDRDTVWVATNRGLTYFDKKTASLRKSPPPIYITSVRVNNTSISPDSSPVLRYNQNNLKFDFIGISYRSSGKILYRYKLEGFDSAWIYSKYATARYTALPPSRYRFIVYARNSDETWSYVPSLFTFTIQRAFWQTWWFYLLVAAGAAVLIYGIFTIRVRAIQHKEQEKTKLNRKIADMELKALRSQMNPHFTFNSLNAIQHYIIRNDKEAAHRYLSKFAKLMRTILEHSKLSSISVEEEVKALYLYLELEALRFEKQFDFHIQVDPSVDEQNDFIPSMLIQPYVENAVWHGLMHKEEKGGLSITMSKKDHTIHCVITDNGIGRKKAQEIRAQRSSSHRSVGMDITGERLDILNHVYSSNVTVNVTDLEDGNGQAGGTRVEIQIPLTNFL